MWSTSPARVCLGWGPDHPAGRGIRHHQLAHTFHGCRARYLRGRRPHNPATEATTPGPRPPCCRLASALGFVRFRIRSAAAASAQAGFDATRPCLVVWIGVSVYLTRTAIDRTLADLTSICARAEVSSSPTTATPRPSPERIHSSVHAAPPAWYAAAASLGVPPCRGPNSHTRSTRSAFPSATTRESPNSPSDTPRTDDRGVSPTTGWEC